jgi:hypothetical protein
MNYNNRFEGRGYPFPKPQLTKVISTTIYITIYTTTITATTTPYLTILILLMQHH